MSQIIEQDVKTLYQGVSRQPDSVRLPGQVQNAENAEFSVVTGGFSKRPGSVDLGLIPGVGVNDNVFVHGYERDADEKYCVIIKNNDLLVFDLEGHQKTVNFPDGKAYLASTDPSSQFRAVTIADYTMIANCTVTVQLLPAPTTPTSIQGPVRAWDDLPYLNEQIADYLRAAYNNGTTYGSYSPPMYVWADGCTGCFDGAIWKVSSDSDPKAYYFSKLSKGSTIWSWKECADPNGQNSFDPATMPWSLVRESDGTFTFKKVTWASRPAGDKTVVPDPDFVGSKLADISFHRDRLTFMSGEVTYVSQSGDYFNFWPDLATLVKDSDPFGRVASSNGVNLVRYGIPFRKAFFIQSDKAQFELSTPDLLTPKKTAIDIATTYETEPRVRPTVLGDMLYFAGRKGNRAQVFEYEYHQDSTSNKAVPITYHVDGYIPAPLVQLSGEATAGALFALSDADRKGLYVYRYFWDGETKAQSAWSHWSFPDVTRIHGFLVLNSSIYMIASLLDGTTRMSRTPITNDILEASEVYPVKLDRKKAVTGTYNSVTNLTTWTTPWSHNSLASVILGDAFGSSAGNNLTVDYPTSSTITAIGDYSAHPCVVGLPYDHWVELSKQFVRSAQQQNGKTVTAGRLQLSQISFDYQNTGYFEVHVTPDGRSTNVYQFTGRVIGSSDNIIGGIPIVESGTFDSPVNTRGSTVTIRIVNNSSLPSTITAMWWYGTYSELTQQG